MITSKIVSCFMASSQNSFRNHHFYCMYVLYPIRLQIKESKHREKSLKNGQSKCIKDKNIVAYF